MLTDEAIKGFSAARINISKEPGLRERFRLSAPQYNSYRSRSYSHDVVPAINLETLLLEQNLADCDCIER